MDLKSILNKVNSKEKFMEFLTELRYDKEQKSDEWENDDLADLIIEKMLNAGNKVYNSIVELQEVIRISYIEGEV